MLCKSLAMSNSSFAQMQNQLCATGYTGLLCNVCDKTTHYRSQGKCYECLRSRDEAQRDFVIVTCVCLAFAMFIIAFHRHIYRFLSWACLDWATRASDELWKAILGDWRTDQRMDLGLFKVIWSTGQVGPASIPPLFSAPRSPR